MAIPFTYTNDSITVVFQGKPHVVQKGQPQFINLRQALMDERWDDVPGHLTVPKSLATWAKGKFTVNEALEQFSYEGTVLPREINSRILSMAAAGESPEPLFLFYERLQRNPSMRSVEQLYKFLQHKGIPLTKDGCFLAYKGVQSDFTDAHTGKVDNRPGTVNKMPRNKISDDPREACHFGFHVGALQYAHSFSQRVVVCKVDPEHVVCVPYDSHEQKMRVCEYKVIGNHGETLPDAIFDENETPTPQSEYEEDPADKDDDAFNGVESEDEDEDVEEDEDEETMAEEEAPEEEELKENIKKDDVIEGVPAKKGQKLQIPAKFKKMAEMAYEDLMKQPIMTLRAFATYGLQITGASKIRNGKVGLLEQITKVLEGKK